MDIHKPKPVHSWRELLSEVGVVVIGIVIALALEQGVELWRDHRRAADAREITRAEIASNLGQMVRRSSTEACVSRRLDEIAGLVAQASAGKPAPGPIWIGHPLVWSLTDGQYKSAVQSGAVSLLPSAEQSAYSDIYAAFADYTADERSEQDAWTELRTLDLQPATTPMSDWQLRSALEHARMARWQMETVAFVAATSSRHLHIEPANLRPFKLESACVPLHTSREEALKLIVAGRPGHHTYDEP